MSSIHWKSVVFGRESFCIVNCIRSGGPDALFVCGADDGFKCVIVKGDNIERVRYVTHSMNLVKLH
jgi:hypothetical protein